MMPNYELQKQQILARKDKSPKGEIDPAIFPLLTIINSSPDYVTTSSCSGRIVLLHGSSKKASSFLFCSHEEVKKIPELELPKAATVWLRFEGAIIHVACKSMKAAANLLSIAQETGFKHSGIISCEPKIVVEIRSPDIISVPVQKNGKSLVQDLQPLVEECNEKLAANHDRVSRLYSALYECLNTKQT